VDFIRSSLPLAGEADAECRAHVVLLTLNADQPATTSRRWVEPKIIRSEIGFAGCFDVRMGCVDERAFWGFRHKDPCNFLLQDAMSRFATAMVIGRNGSVSFGPRPLLCGNGLASVRRRSWRLSARR